MRFISFLKNRQKLLIICLAVVIIAVLGLIYYLNLNNTSTSSLGNGLKNYAAFKQKVNSLTSTNNTYYPRLMEQFAILEANNITAKDRYSTLVNIAQLLDKDYYGSTFNPAFYKLITVDVSAFAKDNFSAFYNPGDFAVTCQDPSCADSPQPATIAAIINEIQTLQNVPEDEKSMMVGNLTNDSYVSGNNALKAQSYLASASIIREDAAFIKAGVNTKIANEIEAFVKTAYSSQQPGTGAAGKQ